MELSRHRRPPGQAWGMAWPGRRATPARPWSETAPRRQTGAFSGRPARTSARARPAGAHCVRSGRAAATIWARRPRPRGTHRPAAAPGGRRMPGHTQLTCPHLAPPGMAGRRATREMERRTRATGDPPDLDETHRTGFPVTIPPGAAQFIPSSSSARKPRSACCGLAMPAWRQHLDPPARKASDGAGNQTDRPSCIDQARWTPSSGVLAPDQPIATRTAVDTAGSSLLPRAGGCMASAESASAPAPGQISGLHVPGGCDTEGNWLAVLNVTGVDQGRSTVRVPSVSLRIPAIRRQPA